MPEFSVRVIEILERVSECRVKAANPAAAEDAAKKSVLAGTWSPVSPPTTTAVSQYAIATLPRRFRLPRIFHVFGRRQWLFELPLGGWVGHPDPGRSQAYYDSDDHGWPASVAGARLLGTHRKLQLADPGRLFIGALVFVVLGPDPRDNAWAQVVDPEVSEDGHAHQIVVQRFDGTDPFPVDLNRCYMSIR